MNPNDQWFFEETENLSIRPLCANDAAALLDLYCHNRDYFAEWEPLRDESFYTLGGMQEFIADAEHEFADKKAVYFGLFSRENGSLIGTGYFTHIVMDHFQACYLNFLLDERHKGQGLMFEGAGRCIDIMFRFGLHRIMANYCPENIRSGKLLARLGFEQEGLAHDYLYLNGRWRDHILTSRTYQPL